MNLSQPQRLLTALALFLSASPTFAADLSIKPGDQVIRIQIQTPQQLAQLEAMDLDIWSHEYGVGPIDVHVSVTELQQIQNAGLTFTVENADLTATRAAELADAAAPRAPGDFTAYKDFDGIIAYINNLATTRPDLCTVTTFGASIENRPLYVLKITGPNPGPKPAVFYHSLIHSREWITGPVALYLAEHLVNNYDTDPCIADLVNRTEFYIAPCVNPDGYTYTWGPQRLWRKNRRDNGDGTVGVDLNRNFGHHWGEAGASPTSSDDTYRGPSAFSEPETQAIRDFILAHPNIKSYMDYHSYSQLILWPWGYTPDLCPDDPAFSAVGHFMRQQILDVHGTPYVAGPINTTIYPASGGSVDWAYANAAALRLAYSIELRPTGGVGFLLPADQILPTCEENLPAILYLSRWASSGVLLDLAGTLPTKVAAGQSTQILVNLVGAQESLIPASALVHYRFDAGDTFVSSPLVLQSGTAYAATLPAAVCGQTAEFYFTAAGDAGGSAVLPCGAPATVFSLPVEQAANLEVAHSFPLTTNPGWTLGSSWTYGTPTGTCGDPTSGFTGTNVYGYRFTACYQNNMSPARYLTTAAIDCSAISDVQLRFRRWLGIEAAIYDRATIEASNNGSTWTTVWNFTGDTLIETAWSLQTVDISSVADGQSTVYVRWGMGPTDGGLGYGGWNIDDVEILGAPVIDCTGVILGDVTGDTALDARDLPAFVNVLLNPIAAAPAETCAADINQTCGVTMEDVDPFVALLLQ